jgi:hypothetical protein
MERCVRVGLHTAARRAAFAGNVSYIAYIDNRAVDTIAESGGIIAASARQPNMGIPQSDSFVTGVAAHSPIVRAAGRIVRPCTIV